MSKVMLMGTPFVSISQDQSNQIVIAKWRGFLKLEEVKEGCRFMTQYFKDHLISVHLSEQRDLKILSAEVQEYLAKEWFPEIEKIGVRKIGAIVADDVFAEVTVRNVNRESTVGKLTMEMFASEADCTSWLLEPFG